MFPPTINANSREFRGLGSSRALRAIFALLGHLPAACSGCSIGFAYPAAEASHPLAGRAASLLNKLPSPTGSILIRGNTGEWPKRKVLPGKRLTQPESIGQGSSLGQAREEWVPGVTGNFGLRAGRLPAAVHD